MNDRYIKMGRVWIFAKNGRAGVVVETSLDVCRCVVLDAVTNKCIWAHRFLPSLRNAKDHTRDAVMFGVPS